MSVRRLTNEPWIDPALKMRPSKANIIMSFPLRQTGDQNYCRTLVCLVLYCHYNILFSSILITIDRYIYITKGIKYPYIVTGKRIIAGVLLSW